VLGEELVTAPMLNRAVDAAFPGLPPRMSVLEARRRTAEALAAVAPDIAARAYKRGRDDGAAAEQERIARRFDSMDGDGWGSLAPVVAGLFEQVARIVRGTS
jgi:hypothetical protein